MARIGTTRRGEARVAQPSPHLRRQRGVGAGVIAAQARIALEQRRRQRAGQSAFDLRAGAMHRLGIDIGQAVGQRSRVGDREDFGDQGGIGAVVVEHRTHAARPDVQQRAVRLAAGERSCEQPPRQRIGGEPAVESVGIVANQPGQRVVVGVLVEPDRRGVAAQQRYHRRFRHVDEAERRFDARQRQYALAGRCAVFAIEAQRKRIAAGAEQFHGDRNRQRALAWLIRCRRRVLAQRDLIVARLRVVATARAQRGRSRLVVPAEPRRQIAAVGGAERA